MSLLGRISQILDRRTEEKWGTEFLGAENPNSRMDKWREGGQRSRELKVRGGLSAWGLKWRIYPLIIIKCVIAVFEQFFFVQVIT